MAIRRVLVFDTSRRLRWRAAVAARHPQRCAPRAPRQAHAYNAQTNQKARKQSDDGRGVAAEPLGVRPAHTVAQTFVLHRLLWLAFRRVICRRPCPLFLYLLPIYRNRFQTVCLVLPDTSQTRFPRNFSLSPPIPGLYRAKFPLR